MARNWFITGTSSGIGAALAQAALAAGDTVVGTVRRPRRITTFEALAPGRAHALLLDVDHLDDIAGAVQAAVDRLGTIDIVVNNAGRSIFGAVEETGLDEAADLMRTNLLAPMAVMQAFLPHFRARGSGLFINMSSGCGLFGTPGVGAYCASKFALEGLSETVAAEAAGFGVKVLLVEPGAVATRFISHGTQDVRKRLSAYEALSGRGKAALAVYYESAAERPESVATAILAALDGGDIPLRLPLSQGVCEGLKHKGLAYVAMACG